MLYDRSTVSSGPGNGRQFVQRLTPVSDGWGLDPFPQALKALMAERSVSLREIARLSGIDAAHLSRMMHGLKTPNVAALSRIAKSLDLPDDYFIEVRAARVHEWFLKHPSELDDAYRRSIGRA